jgi:phosphinothricin acetyltransferase
MAEITVRAAERRDLPALTAIYNHYVRSSHVTFDIDEFTVEARAEWFGHYADHGPHRVLAAERGGRVIGYATSGTFRTKPAYRRSVETSVYVDPGATGSGAGRLLYATLLRLLDREGVHRAYAGVALPNDASEKLHRGFGFTPVGVWTEVGFKFGRFIDVAWFERAAPG